MVEYAGCFLLFRVQLKQNQSFKQDKITYLKQNYQWKKKDIKRSTH